VCWLYVLSTYEVSRALPILGGMGYIALFVLGRLVLDESTTVYNLLGILLLICGVALLV
jgi:multidrug transporter EmrE-like cation transporter